MDFLSLKFLVLSFLHLFVTQAQTYVSNLLSSHGKSFAVDIFNSDCLSDLSVLIEFQLTLL